MFFKKWFRMEGIEQIEILENPPLIPLYVPLIAGGVAGTFTDISLFPLDTLKTRLQQSSTGVTRTSLLRNLYQGLGPAALASAPSASLFFVTYDFCKDYVPCTPLGHGSAAAAGEIAACMFKVPFEVVKQRLQAAPATESSVKTSQMLSSIYRTEGVRGCYAGLSATLAREIPFGFIQMPIYEALKTRVARDRPPTGIEACACGAVAGGAAAAATCPLDVWKTRLMLGGKDSTIISILQREGMAALFSGVVPRVLWISVGGSIFFGAYETIRGLLM